MQRMADSSEDEAKSARVAGLKSSTCLSKDRRGDNANLIKITPQLSVTVILSALLQLDEDGAHNR